MILIVDWLYSGKFGGREPVAQDENRSNARRTFFARRLLRFRTRSGQAGRHRGLDKHQPVSRREGGGGLFGTEGHL